MAQPAVQRGEATLASGNTSVVLTAGVSSGFDTAVAQGRTFLLFSVRADLDVPYDSRLGSVKGVIASDGETVTFTRDRGTSGNLTIEWSLYEFASGSGVSVQHFDVASTSAGSGNVTVSAVDLSKTFIIPSGVNMTSSPMDRWFTRLRFTSTTNVAWSRQDVTGNVSFAFQVVTYPDCAVQQIDVERSGSTSTTEDETISAVDLGATALFGSMDTSATGPTGDWTLSLTSTTNLRLTREGTTSQTFNATVFVVRFTDGTAVQHLATALHDATLVNQTISAVDLAVSALDITNVRGKMCAGRDNGDNLSRTMPTVEFSSTTNVQCRKGAPQGTVDLTFQVIEFAAASGGGEASVAAAAEAAVAATAQVRVVGTVAAAAEAATAATAAISVEGTIAAAAEAALASTAAVEVAAAVNAAAEAGADASGVLSVEGAVQAAAEAGGDAAGSVILLGSITAAAEAFADLSGSSAGAEITALVAAAAEASADAVGQVRVVGVVSVGAEAGGDTAVQVILEATIAAAAEASVALSQLTAPVLDPERKPRVWRRRGPRGPTTVIADGFVTQGGQILITQAGDTLEPQ